MSAIDDAKRIANILAGGGWRAEADGTYWAFYKDDNHVGGVYLDDGRYEGWFSRETPFAYDEAVDCEPRETLAAAQGAVEEQLKGWKK